MREPLRKVTVNLRSIRRAGTGLLLAEP